MRNLRNLFDIAKIIGGTIVDSIDIGQYRISVIIEKKIDEKQGIMVDNISIDKVMNRAQLNDLKKRIIEQLNRQY